MDIPSLRVKSRLWLVGQSGTFLGEGRIDLLEEVGRQGSISGAAQAMNMSYLKAWKLINAMNEMADKPLVHRSTGGKGGGGTKLTREGQEAIAFFKELNTRCQDFLDRELEQMMQEY